MEDHIDMGINFIQSIVLHYVRILIAAVIRGLMDISVHNGVEMAGYLAFLGIIAIFPSFYFFSALISFLCSKFFLLNPHHYENFTGAIDHIFSDNIMIFLKENIMKIILTPPENFFNVAIVSAIWSASSAIEGLRIALNKAFRIVRPAPYLLRKLINVAQFMAIAFVIITIFVITSVSPTLATFSQGNSIAMDHMVTWAISFIASYRFIISKIALFLFFATIMLIVPSQRPSRYIIATSAAMSVFTVSSAIQFFIIYIKRATQMSLFYGSLTGLIYAVFTFYIIFLCIIFSAEFGYHLRREMNENPFV